MAYCHGFSHWTCFSAFKSVVLTVTLKDSVMVWTSFAPDHSKVTREWQFLDRIYFVSWYSFSVLTFQTGLLSVEPERIARTASKAVHWLWSMLL